MVNGTHTPRYTIDDRPESDWIFIHSGGLDVVQLPRFEGQRELADLIVILLNLDDRRLLLFRIEDLISDADMELFSVRRSNQH